MTTEHMRRPFDRLSPSFSVTRGILGTTHCSTVLFQVPLPRPKVDGKVSGKDVTTARVLLNIPDGKCAGNPVRLHCLGVEGPQTQLMMCQEFGRLTCTGHDRSYRPAQFIIRAHEDINGDVGKIVSILSLGMGVEDTFFLALEDNEFTVTEAKKFDKDSYCLPTDEMFHFKLTSEINEGEVERFQAVTGDKPFLAFDANGDLAIDKDVPMKNTQFKSV